MRTQGCSFPSSTKPLSFRVMISNSGMTWWSSGVESDEICFIALRKTWDHECVSELSYFVIMKLTSRTGNSWARRSHSSFDSLNPASRVPRERLCCSITVRSFKASHNRRAHSRMDAVLFQRVETSRTMRSGLILPALHCSSRFAWILGLLKMRFARLRI